MFVSKPIINDGIKKFVSYTLGGSAIGQEVSRRFSDFYSLREKLIERWPGVYIPNVPPKKAVGNTDSKIIDKRIRLLNRFCYQLSTVNFLFESEEVKLFQSNGNEIAKAISALSKPNYQEILEKYKESFPDYYDAYDLVLGKGKLSEFNSFLKRALNNIKTFSGTVSDSMEKKEKEIERYMELMHQFEEHEKYTLMEYAENNENKLVFFNPKNAELSEKVLKLKDSIINPYVLLSEWLEEEELDIEAMLEALGSLTNLNNTYDKLGEKLDSIEKDLKSLQYGDLNIVKKLFKKKETEIANLEKEKETTESNIETLHLIIKYASFNMEEYLEVFKKDKINEYYKHLKSFSLVQKENDRVLQDLWGYVKTDLMELKKDQQ